MEEFGEGENYQYLAQKLRKLYRNDDVLGMIFFSTNLLTELSSFVRQREQTTLKSKPQTSDF